MPDLPSGTVTMLFADLEGSTHILRELGGRYADVLSEYRRLFRSVVLKYGGREVDTQGDAFFVVFVRARDAAAVTAQRRRYKSSSSDPTNALSAGWLTE
jgi:class 3 adenylate cyclase